MQYPLFQNGMIWVIFYRDAKTKYSSWRSRWNFGDIWYVVSHKCKAQANLPFWLADRLWLYAEGETVILRELFPVPSRRWNTFRAFSTIILTLSACHWRSLSVGRSLTLGINLMRSLQRGKASSAPNTWGCGPDCSPPGRRVSSGSWRAPVIIAWPNEEFARPPYHLWLPPATTQKQNLASITTRG